MVKRLIASVVLISMITHCAGRLGFLSYLYQQRHEIANALGLIEEKPIAVCGSEFQPDANLVFTADETNESVPPQLIEVREIQLFFQFKLTGCEQPAGLLLLGDIANTAHQLFEPPRPIIEILQPPKV